MGSILGDEWKRLGATSGYKGNLTETHEVLIAWCERVHRAGIQRGPCPAYSFGHFDGGI